MSSSSLIAPPIPGAGRFFDHQWPAGNGYSSSSALDTAVNSRLNGILLGALSTATGGASAANLMRAHKGRVGFRINTTGVAVGYTIEWGQRLYPTLERPGGDVYGVDESCCYRFVAVLAFSPVVGGGSGDDIGMAIVSAATGGTDRVRQGAGAGAILHHNNAGGLSLTTRAVAGGGAVVRPIALPAGFDIEKPNVGDFRVISATPTDDARLDVYVNGTLGATVPWLPANLPPLQVGTAIGFKARVTNYTGGTIPDMDVSLMRLISAPTPAALL